MNYIVRILIPETKNSIGTYSKRFHTLENYVKEYGGVVVGMPKEYDKEIYKIHEIADMVVIYDSDPVSSFVAANAKRSGIKVLGYVPGKEFAAMKAFRFLCDNEAYGAKEFKAVVEMFIDHGRWYFD